MKTLEQRAKIECIRKELERKDKIREYSMQLDIENHEFAIEHLGMYRVHSEIIFKERYKQHYEQFDKIYQEHLMRDKPEW